MSIKNCWNFLYNYSLNYRCLLNTLRWNIQIDDHQLPYNIGFIRNDSTAFVKNPLTKIFWWYWLRSIDFFDRFVRLKRNQVATDLVTVLAIQFYAFSLLRVMENVSQKTDEQSSHSAKKSYTKMSNETLWWSPFYLRFKKNIGTTRRKHFFGLFDSEEIRKSDFPVSESIGTPFWSFLKKNKHFDVWYCRGTFSAPNEYYCSKK